MAWFRNHYACDQCKKSWTDEWFATCDDDCPHCSARHMSPHQSDDLSLHPPSDAAKVARLNDHFRRTLKGGRVVLTAGVDALPEDAKAVLLLKVAAFEDFTEDNDPHKEHDFGSLELLGEKFFWKIDYYDAQCHRGSEDPTDPDKTTRILTVMRAEDY